MTESVWFSAVPRIQEELHFDDRRIRCFADRPRSVYALLSDAVSRCPEGEALVLGNSASYVTIIFALARIGVIVVPIGTRSSASEIAYMLENSDCCAVFCDSETAVRRAMTLIVMPAFKAKLFLQLAERERMTHTLMVPAMYNLYLLQPGFSGLALKSWRLGAYGGAPMPPATIEALAGKLGGLELMNAYGATETTSPATMTAPRSKASHIDTVGISVPCAEIIIADFDGTPLPTGTSGEIWIRGPMVVKGYWQNPIATGENFTDGFWHSGDIGTMDDRGFVRILDRIKGVINRGGYKVYSSEVEAVLASHPQVIESAVVGRPCSPAWRTGARLCGRARRGQRRVKKDVLRRADVRLQSA